MTYKYSAFSFLLITVFGFAMWMTYWSYHQPRRTVSASTIELSDAWMENVNAIVMDKQGKPSIKIRTPKMVHFTTGDTTHLTLPKLTLYHKSPKPWHITAKYAKATQGMENVNFRDHVVIQHAADSSSPATLIKTSTLMVHPNQQLAETTDLITLLQPNLSIHATGMKADMNTGNIKLLSAARGEYVPNT